MLTLYDPITVPSQKYTFALAHGLRFYDERFCSFIVKLVFEAFGICWKYPGSGKEIEEIREISLHVGQVPRKKVLACQNVAGRHVVYPLIGFHFEEERGKNRAIYPPYVPVFLLIGGQAEITLISTIL